MLLLCAEAGELVLVWVITVYHIAGKVSWEKIFKIEMGILWKYFVGVTLPSTYV